MQSDMAFPDDEIVGLRGLRRSNLPGAGEIPRVVDATAETLGIKFEKFLEEYIKRLALSLLPLLTKVQVH